MAGVLTIEVDEDVPLVENAATATLFSPGMWVQRPSRTPAFVAAAAEEEEEDGQQQQQEQQLRPASGLAMEVDEQRRVSLIGAVEPLVADPDLAYLNIADETDNAEREYLKQDSEHMAALEDAYARLREQNRVMEQQLKGVVAAVNDVMEENRTIKQLLAMLQVRREDFVFNQQQTIAAQQEAIGMRLLQNLDGDAPGAQEQRQQQQQGAAPGQPSQEQQEQQQQQPGSQPQGQEPGAEQQVAAAVAAAAFDASPGCLLPITPGMRTVSPKIGAFRQEQQQPAPPPTVVPASPYDFPAEAQIAAAALTAKQGDTAAALLTLLDKAMEGRLERQKQAQKQQQLLQQQQHGQQPPLYHM